MPRIYSRMQVHCQRYVAVSHLSGCAGNFVQWLHIS